MLSFMSQNQTSFSFPGVFSTVSVPQAEFEHEGSEIDHGLNDIPPTDSSWSSNTKSQTELEDPPGGGVGRRILVSVTWKFSCSSPKNLYDSYNPPDWRLIFGKFSMFPPLCSVGDSWSSSVSLENRVIPPEFLHLVGFILTHVANQYLISLSSETDISLTLPSSWSADTPTSSCVVASMDDDCYITGIREEVIHLTHFDLDGQWFLVGILGVKLTANNATIQPW